MPLKSYSACPEREPAELLYLLCVTSTTIHDAIKLDILTTVYARFNIQEISDGVLSLHMHLGVGVFFIFSCIGVKLTNVGTPPGFPKAPTKSRSNKLMFFYFFF